MKPIEGNMNSTTNQSGSYETGDNKLLGNVAAKSRSQAPQHPQPKLSNLKLSQNQDHIANHNVDEILSNFNDDYSRQSIEKTGYQLLKTHGGQLDLDLTVEEFGDRLRKSNVLETR